VFAFDAEGRLRWDTLVYSCPQRSGKAALDAPPADTGRGHRRECPRERGRGVTDSARDPIAFIDGRFGPPFELVPSGAEVTAAREALGLHGYAPCPKIHSELEPPRRN